MIKLYQMILWLTTKKVLFSNYKNKKIVRFSEYQYSNFRSNCFRSKRINAPASNYAYRVVSNSNNPISEHNRAHKVDTNNGDSTYDSNLEPTYDSSKSPQRKNKGVFKINVSKPAKNKYEISDSYKKNNFINSKNSNDIAGKSYNGRNKADNNKSNSNKPISKTTSNSQNPKKKSEKSNKDKLVHIANGTINDNIANGIINDNDDYSDEFSDENRPEEADDNIKGKSQESKKKDFGKEGSSGLEKEIIDHK